MGELNVNSVLDVPVLHGECRCRTVHGQLDARMLEITIEMGNPRCRAAPSTSRGIRA